MESLPAFKAEVAKTPSERFSVLLQRFEHMIERAPSVEGLSVYIPESNEGAAAWLRLGIYVEKHRGTDEQGADVLLSARWGHAKDAADMSHQMLSMAVAASGNDSAKIEETLSLLEVAAGCAENEYFGLNL